MDSVIGRLVYSKAGRDKSRPMIVVDVIDCNYVLVADGNLRKINKPKKKRLKHLKISNIIFEEILMKISKFYKINDAEIRKALEVNQ